MILKAGELIFATCPGEEKPLLKVGDKLPNNEHPIIKVLKIEGNRLTLGPLKSGELSVSIPCTLSTQELQATVQSPSQEDQLKRYDPLEANPIAIPYLLYLLIIIGIIALSLISYFAFRKKKIKQIVKTKVKTKVSPREALLQSLSYLKTNVRVPETHHFHDLYKKIRRFVEVELSLHTKSLTSAEFLGTFRALALQQSANQNFVSLLEYLLKTADELRFTGKGITSELWSDYLNKVQTLTTLIEPPQNKQNNPKISKKGTKT